MTGCLFTSMSSCSAMSVDSRSDASQIVIIVFLFGRVQALERKDYGLLALIAEQAAGSMLTSFCSQQPLPCARLLGSNSGLRKHGRAGIGGGHASMVDQPGGPSAPATPDSAHGTPAFLCELNVFCS